MPKVGNLQGDISEHIAENGKISTERDTPELKRVLVYVHKRDTLSSIADRYDVSVSQIKAWNKVGKGLKRGQRLTLVVPYNKVIHSQKPEPEEVHKPSEKLFIAKLNNKKSRNNLAENTTNNNSKFRNSKVDRHEKNRKKNDKSDRIAKKEKIEVAKEDKHSKHAKLVRVAEKRQHITRN
jgi:LysM repeat protein